MFLLKEVQLCLREEGYWDWWWGHRLNSSRICSIRLVVGYADRVGNRYYGRDVKSSMAPVVLQVFVLESGIRIWICPR